MINKTSKSRLLRLKGKEFLHKETENCSNQRS